MLAIIVPQESSAIVFLEKEVYIPEDRRAYELVDLLSTIKTLYAVLPQGLKHRSQSIY